VTPEVLAATVLAADGLPPGWSTMFVLVGGLAIALPVTVIVRTIATLPLRRPAGRLPMAVEIALLSQQPNRAVYSSVTALWAHESISLDDDGRLRFGPLPASAGPVDRVVYDALRRGTPASSIAQEPTFVTAMDDLARAAVKPGWMLSRAERIAARVPSLLFFALTAVGVYRIVLEVRANESWGNAAVLTVIALLGGFATANVDVISGRGRRTVQRVYDQFKHLQPSNTPAWSTYGPAAAAMSAALWGEATIWRADPAFAQAVGVPRPQGYGRHSDSGGDGCGDGDDSCSGGCGGGCGD